jgi:hypothetical protein
MRWWQRRKGPTDIAAGEGLLSESAILPRMRLSALKSMKSIRVHLIVSTSWTGLRAGLNTVAKLQHA